MDSSYNELLDMGFIATDIQRAVANGCSSIAEVVDYICNPLARSVNPSVPPLRLGKNIRSQFQPNISGQVGAPNPRLTPIEPLAPQQPVSSQPLQPESDSGEKNEPLKSRYKLLKPSLESQQQEARKVAETIRLEKEAKAEERARILREIKEDRLKRSEQQLIQTPVVSPEPETATTSNDKSTDIQIRVNLPKEWLTQDSTNMISVITLDPYTACYREVAEFVQTQLDKVATTATDHDHLHVALPCLSLFTSNWPRKRLPSFLDELLEQSLIEVGLTENTSIILDHLLSACDARKNPEEILQQEEEHPVEDNIIWQEPMVTEGEPTQSPYRSVTPPPPVPDGFPRILDRIGAAAERRANRVPLISHVTRADDECEDFNLLPLFTPILSLRDTCLSCIVTLIGQYIRAGYDAQVNFDGFTQNYCSSKSGTSGAIHALRSMAFPWPESIGQALIKRLCQNHYFNTRSAQILKNSISRLDLGFYPLVTSDLVILLARYWPNLRELHLNGLPLHQVSSISIQDLSNLKHLRVLNLDDLLTVNDATILSLATLPNLVVLRVASTSVTESGWRKLASSISPVASNGSDHVESSSLSPSPLRHLDISKTPNFTDLGLASVASCFPNLVHLKMTGTLVTGIAPLLERAPFLTRLTYLDVVDCVNLLQLPVCLLGTVTSGLRGGSLRHLRVDGCPRLRVPRFLEQIHSQPLERVDGLQKLPQLTTEDLRTFLGTGYPLKQVCFKMLSLSDATDGGGISLDFLIELISHLPCHSLQLLELPIRPAAVVKRDGESVGSKGEALATAIRQLINLSSLDLGGQTVHMSADQLASACAPLHFLVHLAGDNITKSQEKRLKDVIKDYCRIRLRHHLQPEPF